MTPTAQERLRWRNVAAGAAALATAFIVEETKTRDTLVWEEKTANDFVSRVDLGAEEIIRRHFAQELPELRVVGEELGGGGTDEGLVAIVDPLDGTTNFLHGFPHYAVSICVALDGVPQAAAIYDVRRGGIYNATLGGGAFVDLQPIRVSTLTAPARALIGTGFPFKDQSFAQQYLAQFSALTPQVAGLRRAGAAALDLCDVACGRFDGFWELYLAPWDLAAGILIVREAGGRATDLDGNDATLRGGPIVASNGVMHDWLLQQLAVGPRQA
jgi:myo-inositol-1(or 4)-monophosphatase